MICIYFEKKRSAFKNIKKIIRLSVVGITWSVINCFFNKNIYEEVIIFFNIHNIVDDNYGILSIQ